MRATYTGIGASNLAAALAARGVAVAPGILGLSVYIPVASETYALVTLAAHGIAVNAGAKFSTRLTSGIRVASSVLSDDQRERVADALVLACDRPSV